MITPPRSPNPQSTAQAIPQGAAPDPSVLYQQGDVAPSSMASAPPSQATQSYSPQQAAATGLNWVGKNDQMFGEKGYVGYQEPVTTPVPSPAPGASVASPLANPEMAPQGGGSLERRALLSLMR